ncbi:MAG: hypothetical protein IPP94_03560 [Ignavibacteria bacterium]|nr:hypothetical protein [Ignavibacteria bacterium]
MKTASLILLACTLCVMGMLSAGCRGDSEKIDEARDNVREANATAGEAAAELHLAIQDSIRQFRTDAEAKIADYEKAIAEYKVKISREKKQNRARYERNLAVVEQKNKELKVKLNEYSEDGQDAWRSFKSEFSRDMDDLGTALSNMVSSDNQ